MPKSADKSTQCAEHGIWTSVPAPLTAGHKPLDFSVRQRQGTRQEIQLYAMANRGTRPVPKTLVGRLKQPELPIYEGVSPPIRRGELRGSSR